MMKIIFGLAMLLCGSLACGNPEYYKAYPGIHCDGMPYHVNYLETDTIESCNKACDSLPECAAYAIRDNWSIGGCYLKNEACLQNMNPKPGVTMFVKPKSIKMAEHVKDC